MKLSMKTQPGSPWRRLRLWVLPALALILFLEIYEPGFDREAMNEALLEGRPDDALELLQLATNKHVLPELVGVFWWPAEARAKRLKLLAGDLAKSPENPNEPTILSPRGKQRLAPSQVRISRPLNRPLQWQLHHRGMTMLAASGTVAANQEALPFEAMLLPASTYDVVLNAVDAQASDGAGAMVCLTDFTMLPEPEAHDLGVLMKSAWNMAPDEFSAELLASLVAMNYGLYNEAMERLETLGQQPGYEQITRELQAIALARLDLDHSAMSRLQQ
ncbi:MAG: hypothetical protein ACI9EF_003289 [Pseudohongiellaceae bacterium]|jgi:hypothetical protein